MTILLILYVIGLVPAYLYYKKSFMDIEGYEWTKNDRAIAIFVAFLTSFLAIPVYYLFLQENDNPNAKW